MNTPALDELITPIPDDADEMDIANIRIIFHNAGREELAALKQSNADLLAALEEAVKYMSLQNAPIVYPEIRRQDILPKAISAIAAAKGEGK